VVSTSDALRNRYVEGVRLISEVRASVSRGNDVLSIVESGSDAQAVRIADMELRLQGVQRATGYLDTESARRVAAGQKLLREKARLEERFAVLEPALADDKALLAGATKTVDELLTAADRSGKLSERRVADITADELKIAAEQVHMAADRLAQMQLRVKLEFTLLQGLQARASGDAADIKAVNAEQVKIAVLVSAQRTAVDKLAAALVETRHQLSDCGNEFSRAVEQFRVVQVGVLRRWLVDGPPAGEAPSLTIMDVQEAGFLPRLRRPDPASTVLGSMGEGIDANAAPMESRSMSKFHDDGEVDSTQSSPDVIQLSKRAKWYLAMLSRLTSFVGESMDEAFAWSSEAEAWRNGLSSAGRVLAEQRGVLATLQMEQEIVTTTVALIANQEGTAGEQVRSVSADVDRQTKRLETISAELKKQSGQ